MKPRQTILFVTAGLLSTSRARFVGISRFAAEKGWNVQVVENAGASTPYAEIVRFWKPLGVILEYGEDLPIGAVRRFCHIPVVCLDRNPDWGGVCVCQDSHAAGEMVARELLHSGDRQSFGYIGYSPPKYWDEERRAGFVETLARHGRTCSLFKSCGGGEPVLLRHIGEWVSSLRRPCGIMAANDVLSAKVLGVCARLGLSVPEDVSIAGVDNALHICENASVTLTSVEPDFEGSGYLAAQLVDGMSGKGESGQNRVVRFGERRLVRRSSTMAAKRSDAAVRRSVDFIRRNAASGIGVEDVVREIGCSRRSAERRFRMATGCTIFELIETTRVGLVQDRLRNPAQAVGPLADICGFGTEANLRRAFRLATGLSPRQWQLQNANARPFAGVGR